MQLSNSTPRSFASFVVTALLMAAGSFAAAFSLEVFLLPNSLIDGGVVGVAMIVGNLFGHQWIPILIVLFNLPFLMLAWKHIGKHLVVNMLTALLFLSGWMGFIHHFLPSWTFVGDPLEVVVIGGAILGMGFGTIIRVGGCTDGTEILGIMMSQKKGYTVGQVVLACNVLIFSAAGLVFQDWHPPMLSLIAYIVAVKVMDAVIVGLEETKSVTIISAKSQKLIEAITREMGLGLTVLYGRGGFSGNDQEILMVVVERIQLAELKEIVYRHDEHAFMAIENLHEVANGRQIDSKSSTRMTMERIVSRVLGGASDNKASKA